MTTKTTIQETVANAQILAGQLKSCALETEVPSVRNMFEEMSQQVEDIIPKLQGRLSHIQDEEPQYK